MHSKFTDREERSQFEADTEEKSQLQQKYFDLQEKIEKRIELARMLSNSSTHVSDQKQYANLYFFLIEEVYSVVDEIAGAAGLDVGPSVDIVGFPVYYEDCSRCNGSGTVAESLPFGNLSRCGLCRGTGKKMVRSSKEIDLLFPMSR